MSVNSERWVNGQTSTVLEHDPEKACPGLDPGWAPVFGKDHAPTCRGLAAVRVRVPVSAPSGSGSLVDRRPSKAFQASSILAARTNLRASPGGKGTALSMPDIAGSNPVAWTIMKSLGLGRRGVAPHKGDQDGSTPSRATMLLRLKA
jgi:hypothetical protein